MNNYEKVSGFLAETKAKTKALKLEIEAAQDEVIEKLRKIEAAQDEVIEKLRNTESMQDKIDFIKELPEELCKEHSWILHLPSFEKSFGQISWHDEFCVERYNKVTLAQCLEGIEDEYDEELWPKEKVAAFVNAWLEAGVLAFTCDW